MTKKRPSRRKPPYKRINGVKKQLNRIVMEDHLGRCLESYEHVYHRDGDSTNNELENLVIIIKRSAM